MVKTDTPDVLIVQRQVDKTTIVLGSHNQSCCGEVEAILNRTSWEVKKEG